MNAVSTDLAKRVVVAMSGGVDSSVAALILQEQGYAALGVSMQVWDYRNHGGCKSRATCCAPDDFTDARKVAAKVGIPYYVFDFEHTFREEVIQRFVRTYEQGLTPNPCVDCNSRVKFLELRKRALSMGVPCVATGHYARIEQTQSGYRLLRGSDDAKDQSYFLYGLTQSELGQTLFPVGHLTKAEVRELALSAGLATASKPESQDICFVSGSVSDFLVKLGAKRRTGQIVTSQGQVIGSHDGIQNFTVGQRRGLQSGGHEEPLYVLELDSQNNRVIVGKKVELEREKFLVGEINWVARECLQKCVSLEFPFELKVMVQVRSRHRGAAATVKVTSADTCEVRFDDDWAVVSPGQAAVFYDLANEEVFGGGRIGANC